MRPRKDPLRLADRAGSATSGLAGEPRLRADRQWACPDKMMAQRDTGAPLSSSDARECLLYTRHAVSAVWPCYSVNAGHSTCAGIPNRCPPSSDAGCALSQQRITKHARAARHPLRSATCAGAQQNATGRKGTRGVAPRAGPRRSQASCFVLHGTAEATSRPLLRAGRLPPCTTSNIGRQSTTVNGRESRHAGVFRKRVVLTPLQPDANVGDGAFDPDGS